MPLHRLTTITIGVPNVADTAQYYAEFGLAREPDPAVSFSTGDGGVQLRLQATARRRLVELRVGADDPDDIDRIASSLARLGVAAQRSETGIRTYDPGTEVAVVVEIADRIVQAETPAPPYNTLGHISRPDTRAPGVLREAPLQRSKAVEQSHTQAARSDPRRRLARIDARQRVEAQCIQRVGAAPTSCVASQHVLGADVATCIARGDQAVTQLDHIAQTQVDALPCQRVHRVRRIAKQYQALRLILLGQLQLQRKRRARRRGGDVAQPKIAGETELIEKGLIVQCQHALCLGFRQRPDQGAATVRQRQQRQRSARQKTLPGGTLVRSLGTDMRHHGTLRIVTTMRGDAGELTQRRAGTIGSYQQTCRQRFAIRQFDLYAICVSVNGRHVESAHFRWTQPTHACRFQCLPQRPLHEIVLDDVAKQVAPFTGGIEIDRCTVLGIPYMHVGIRARARVANGRPDAQIIQQGK